MTNKIAEKEEEIIANFQTKMVNEALDMHQYEAKAFKQRVENFENVDWKFRDDLSNKTYYTTMQRNPFERQKVGLLPREPSVKSEVPPESVSSGVHSDRSKAVRLMMQQFLPAHLRKANNKKNDRKADYLP